MPSPSDAAAFDILSSIRRAAAEKRAFAPSPAVAQMVMAQAGAAMPPGPPPGPGGDPAAGGGMPPGGPPPGDPAAGGMPPGAPPGPPPGPPPGAGGDPSAGPPLGPGGMPPEIQQAINQAVQQALAQSGVTPGAPGAAPGAPAGKGGKANVEMMLAEMKHKMSVIEKTLRPIADGMGIKVDASELFDMAPPAPGQPGAGAPQAAVDPNAAAGAPPPSNIAQQLPSLPPVAAKAASSIAYLGGLGVAGLAKLAAPIPPTAPPAVGGMGGVAKPMAGMAPAGVPKPIPGYTGVDIQPGVQPAGFNPSALGAGQSFTEQMPGPTGGHVLSTSTGPNPMGVPAGIGGAASIPVNLSKPKPAPAYAEGVGVAKGASVSASMMDLARIESGVSVPADVNDRPASKVAGILAAMGRK